MDLDRIWVWMGFGWGLDGVVEVNFMGRIVWQRERDGEDLWIKKRWHGFKGNVGFELMT